MSFDIFISYRNDAQGQSIGRGIKKLLDQKNYSVYFNPDERNTEYFTDELRDAIADCKDFILVVTQGCLERLLSNRENDILCKEVVTAHQLKKHLIPLLIDGVNLPDQESIWSEELSFLYYVNYISFPSDPDRFFISPIKMIESKVISKPDKGYQYKNTYNSNSAYNVYDDYLRIKKLALEGDIDALYELSIIYFYGFSDDEGHSQRDYEKAYDCFVKLCETDSKHRDYALNMIGHMYYKGLVPRENQSYEESLKRHIAASKSISSAAQHAAYMLSIGSGCEFDYIHTKEFYEGILSSADSMMLFGFANFLKEHGDYVRSSQIYRQLYSKHPASAIELGKMYKNGVLSNPPKPDYFMVAYYFQHAIQLNDCGAEPYYELGKMYFNPTGTFPKDFKLAEQNFKIAAEKGSNDALYMLGYMYDNGHVGRNYDMAIHYHELAVKKGNIQSAHDLAVLFQQPGNVNYHKAFKYAKIAAEAGSSLGEFLCATLLLFGRGCESDMNEAYRLFKHSYDRGFVQSKIMLQKIEKLSDNLN